MKILKSLTLTVSMSAVPLMAMAQTISGSPFDGNRTLPAKSYNSFSELISGLLQNIANNAFALLIALSVMFVIYAAYLYLAAGGSDENVTKATHIIRYAAIAIIVAVLARSLPAIVSSFLGP